MGRTNDRGGCTQNRRGRAAGVRARPALAVVAAMAMLVASCSGRQGTAAVRPRRPAGTILGSVGFSESGLGSYVLPSGAVHQMRLPYAPKFESVVVAAFWADAPTVAYVLMRFREGRSQVFAASTSRPPRPVGPPIGPADEAHRAGDLLMVGVCGPHTGLYLLDLRRPSAWRRVVAGACRGALSPDGRVVAYTTGGPTVLSVDSGAGTGATTNGQGARPTRLLDLRTVPEVRTAGVKRPVVGSMSWGRGGLAMVVTDARGGLTVPSAAVVVRTGIRTVRVVPLSSRHGAPLPGLAWQPGGGLLAFDAALTTGGAVVRLLDPSTGRVRVIAADVDWIGRLVWSPDGEAVAMQVSSGALLLVDLQGNWLARVRLGGVAPFDWQT